MMLSEDFSYSVKYYLKRNKTKQEAVQEFMEAINSSPVRYTQECIDKARQEIMSHTDKKC